MDPEQLTAVDVVVELAGCHGTEAIRDAVSTVGTAIGSIAAGLRVVVACGSDVSSVWPDGQAADGAVVTTVPCAIAAIGRFPSISANAHDGYRVLFELGRRTRARALLMLGSELNHLTPALVQALARPVLDKSFDVVAPTYARQVFDDLLNSAIVYPLTRALYGRRIPGQIGLDFGFSARIADRSDAPDRPAVHSTRQSWIIPQAVSDDLRVCQAHLDVRLAPAPGAADVRAVISQVLGSLFLDLEHRAPFWQRVQRSQPVPVFGAPAPERASQDAVDVRPMIDSFVLAYRNLREVWTLVLPPATLVELKRLTAVGPDEFRLPDDLWARIVYDFALGHRTRAISRDHLLGSLTPAYLAWVASYAIEMRGATRAAADARLEKLCLAFEAEKPYLVRRWRWPDRFNP